MFSNYKSILIKYIKITNYKKTNAYQIMLAP